MDVVVAGERVGLQVLRPILDPLDGLAGEERGGNGQDVARVDRDLPSEPTADVVGDDPDVVLVDGQTGAPGNEGQHRPDGVGRLRCHVEGELLADRVPIGNAATRLDRSDVDARDVDVFLDHDLAGRDGRVRGFPVAGFPVPDVIGLLVRPAVGTEHECVRFHGLVRVHDDRQRLVVDEDGGDTVGCRIPRGGDDRCDLLRLVHDGVHREHHLHVAGKGRHPVELVTLQVLARDDGGDARDLQRLGGVDRLDRGVGVGTPDDVEPELPRQVDVFDVFALAADEAWVFLALDRVAHATDLGAGAGLGCSCGHLVTPRSTGRDRRNRSGSRQRWPSRRPPAGSP